MDSDLEYILIDKAKAKSDILQRLTNLQKHGGIRMYAEVYKWFTETSGQCLMEQMQATRNPKAAAKEEETSEAIEAWEEKMNRLARHGDDYKMAENFKKVALKHILVGKLKDNFEQWEFETPKPTFEDLLKRVKEQARSKKLERDVQRGRTGISLGANQANHSPSGQEYDSWNGKGIPGNPNEPVHQELNSAQSRKGKGDKGKGKGKGDQGKGVRATRAKAKGSQVRDHPRVDVSFATGRTGCRSAPTTR